MPSIFQRPPIRRQIVSTSGLARHSIEVSTFAQLVNAVGLAARRGASDNSFRSLGSEIVIVAPIIFTSSVIIPSEAEGLTIRATSVVTLSASVAVDYAFVVRASRVRIIGLTCVTIGVTDHGFRGLVSIESTVTNQITAVEVDGNSFTSRSGVPGMFVESDSQYATDIYIKNNRATATSSGSSIFCRITGQRWIVTGNSLNEYDSIRDSATGGQSIITNNSMTIANMFLRLGLGENVIMGNLIGGDLDTSGTATGFTTIIGNLIVGTVTTHAADISTAGGDPLNT